MFIIGFSAETERSLEENSWQPINALDDKLDILHAPSINMTGYNFFRTNTRIFQYCYQTEVYYARRTVTSMFDRSMINPLQVISYDQL